MLDTSLSLEEIYLAIIRRNGDALKNLYVPRVSFGMGITYEADLICMTKSGYVTEFEIKRSFADFKADFKKHNDAHKGDWVYKFLFVLPISIEEKVEQYIMENGIEPRAIWYYSEEGEIVKSNGKQCFVGGRRLFLEEQYQLARLGTLRYWKLVHGNNAFKVSY